jgi:hypothetical protein
MARLQNDLASRRWLPFFHSLLISCSVTETEGLVNRKSIATAELPWQLSNNTLEPRSFPLGSVKHNLLSVLEQDPRGTRTGRCGRVKSGPTRKP